MISFFFKWLLFCRIWITKTL